MLMDVPCVQWFTCLRAAAGQDQGAAQAVEGLYDQFCRSLRSAVPAGAYPQVPASRGAVSRRCKDWC